ncbi:hypothetical protein PM082_012154 [Marasmius tenuissimus]|nr:hypothetical protein PM082_012154 [Marasmius tenuissimus]
MQTTYPSALEPFAFISQQSITRTISASKTMSNSTSSGGWARGACDECRKRKTKVSLSPSSETELADSVYLKCEDRSDTMAARCKQCVKTGQRCSWESQAMNLPTGSMANADHHNLPQSLEDGTMVDYNTGNGPSTTGGHPGNYPNTGGGSNHSTSLNTMRIPNEILYPPGQPVLIETPYVVISATTLVLEH